MSHFEYFYYDWFVDARFRIYFAQASLNPYKPFVRSFLQFYHSPNLNHIYKSTNQSRETYTKVIKKRLKLQLYAWLKTNEIPPSSNLRDLLALKPTWKLGSLFFISRLVQDFHIKDHQYSFFYWKDTSSSGYQNYSILTKSLRLAQASSLSKTTNADIYTLVSNRILNEIKTIRKIIKALSPELLLLTKNINFNVPLDINIPPEFNVKYKYFLSNSKLKEIKKHASTDNYDKFIYLFILKKMYQFVRLLKINPTLLSYFNRSLWKRPTMTDLYASSRKGRANQCIEKIIEIALTNGEWINNGILSILKQLLFRLDHVFTTFLNEHYPEKNYVKDAIKKLCTEAIMKPILIDSINGIFLFEPNKLRSYKFDYKRADNKRILSTIKLNTDRLDYQRFSTSFTSNLLQAVDAIIVGIFQQEILKYQQKHDIHIPFFTIHDCWFIHPAYCFLLDELCLKSVKIFYDMDFEKQFQHIPLLYEAFQRYAKENPQNILKKEDINNPDFIKH
jgi:DNA-dependent RNA polymerase